MNVQINPILNAEVYEEKENAKNVSFLQPF